MKISFLVRGNKAREGFEGIALPDAVTRTIGIYKAEGGDLFFISFAMDANTISNARILASFRDSLPGGADVRTLQDEASAKFCELLYPHFCRFEKGLREAITVATCAEKGNFDDKSIVDLEEKLTLEQLYKVLFIDGRFVKDARNLTKGDFTRDDIIARISALIERQPWNVLFSDDDMPTFREKHALIKDRRNDVMHYHKMNEAVFDETRELLKSVNAEIDAYLEGVRNDVTYPKARAESARVAAQMLCENYSDMLEGIRSALDLSAMYDFGDQFSSISKLFADSVDVSGFVSVQAANNLSGGIKLARAAQQAMDTQALCLTPSVASALESMQTYLAKVDLGQISAMQSAMESFKSIQAPIATQWADAFKGVSDNYQHIIPSDAFDNLRLAASASMDFTAGLGIGSAISHAITADALGNIDLEDDADVTDLDDSNQSCKGEMGSEDNS